VDAVIVKVSKVKAPGMMRFHNRDQTVNIVMKAPDRVMKSVAAHPACFWKVRFRTDLNQYEFLQRVKEEAW
jgi:hypothetical protein